ncbi:glycosyltransferase [Candidatus Micrarchaeota archaeon]|nr:glycosyltransferase [Candidatus Micrarchaeota archaeon]
MEKLKIALYQPWIYQPGGMERVILEMTSPASRHDWTIFTNHFSPSTTFSDFSSRRVVLLRRVPLERTPLGLIEVAGTLLGQKLPLGDFDALVVSTAGFGEFVTLRNHSKPAVAFCHTPLRVIHDRTARNALLKRKMHTLPAFLAFEAAYKAIAKRAWRHFTAVAANSIETKKRIVGGGLAPDSKVTIVHPGVHTGKIAPGGKFGKYFLVPGRITPLKNVELAIDAFKIFQRRVKGFRLVVAGGVDYKNRPYYGKLVDNAMHERNVVFMPNISEGKLHSLYSNCHSVLFTALNEDWGIVPIEAMAYGKPVLAVNEGGPLESVLDGRTGYLLPPLPEAFALGMQNLAEKPGLARRMGREGRKHSKKFDWKIFVKRMDGLVEKAATGKPEN